MKSAKEMTNYELARYMDYSILKPEFTEEKVAQLAKWGVDHKVRCIAVNPCWMDLCIPLCEGSDSTVAPAVDFPFGNGTTAMRVAQIEDIAKRPEVIELDVVMNFGLLRSGKDEEVIKDLTACAKAAHAHNIVIKVILETDALSEEEIRRGCECVIAAGCDYIKTSTGFLTGRTLRGAANDVVEIVIDQNRGRVKVKGSGCVRTREHFMELIDLGVDRIGLSYSSAPVVFGLEERL